MRILLFTGKGGVGKTTVAAATALAAAGHGHKTLLVSADPAHSLGDALGSELGPDPVELDAGLSAMQLDTRVAFERSWRQVQRWLIGMLDAGGIGPVEAEELTVLPGAEDVLALLEVRDQARSGRYDLLVLDCAPTADTLRLLALPEALRWWMDRLLPVERRVMRSLRPVLSRAGGAAMPDEEVYAAVGRLAADLAEVQALLCDPDSASVRLVLTPEAVVVAEARRTLTSLSLYGYQVDAVVANRLFPPGGQPWQAGWVGTQQALMSEVTASFAPLPVLSAPYQPAEPVGPAALAAVGRELYGSGDPLAAGTPTKPLIVERTTDGFAISLALPFATRGQVGLARRGDELVLTVGGHRRLVALPSALRRCDVVGAALRDGRLVVRFVPDPAQWMRTAP